MSDGPLSRELLDLVARSLATMEQIEALLLLRREPARAWSAEQVAAEQRIGEPAARVALDALVEHRLAARTGGAYQYAPQTPALGAAVDQLAVAYATRPVTLIKALYSRPAPSAAQSFADVFRIRKPGEGDT